MKVIVDPREMVCGFGEYAVVVNPDAPETMEIVGPPGDPDEGVVTVALLPPHAAVIDTRTQATTRRRAMKILLSAGVCKAVAVEFGFDLRGTRVQAASRAHSDRVNPFSGFEDVGLRIVPNAGR